MKPYAQKRPARSLEKALLDHPGWELPPVPADAADVRGQVFRSCAAAPPWLLTRSALSRRLLTCRRKPFAWFLRAVGGARKRRPLYLASDCVPAPWRPEGYDEAAAIRAVERSRLYSRQPDPVREAERLAEREDVERLARIARGMPEADLRAAVAMAAVYAKELKRRAMGGGVRATPVRALVEVGALPSPGSTVVAETGEPIVVGEFGTAWMMPGDKAAARGLPPGPDRMVCYAYGALQAD